MPLRESDHPKIEIPNTRRYQESVNHTGMERRRHKIDKGENDRQTLQGTTWTLEQAEGGKVGTNRCGTWR